MTQVANLVTKVTADTSSFTSAMDGVKKSALSFSNVATAGLAAVTAAFTATAAAAAYVGNEVFKSADKISSLFDNTQKIGITVAAFQELAVAANEAGVSTDSLQTLLGNMNRRLGDAALNGGTTAKAISSLGLSLQQLKALRPEEQFELIASKLRQVKDIQLETIVATDIFGKSGKDAVALFNSNIDESVQKVRELGITLTQGQAEALDKLGETKDLLGTMWDGFKDNVAAELAPAFQDFLDYVMKSVKELGGLKKVASDVANSIVKAMNYMTDAIKTAVDYIKTVKQAYDTISQSYIGKQIKENIGMFGKAASFVGKSIIGGDAPDSFYASAPKPLGSSNTGASAASQAETVAKVANARAVDLSSQVMLAYKDRTKEAAEAMKTLKDSAMKTAEVLDSYKAIQNALDAPGKSQANDIINQGADGARSQLANSTEFQALFTETLKDVRSGDRTQVEENLRSLQDIINTAKEGFMRYDEATGDYRSDGMDTSGLTIALNELKSYLANPTPKQQQVEVKIKVDAGKDFVTTVTTSQTFKQAVEAQFAATAAAAARGTAP